MFADLPREVALHVIRFVDDPADLLRIEATCKASRAIVDDLDDADLKALWSRHRWGFATYHDAHGSWAEFPTRLDADDDEVATTIARRAGWRATLMVRARFDAAVERELMRPETPELTFGHVAREVRRLCGGVDFPDGVCGAPWAKHLAQWLWTREIVAGGVNDEPPRAPISRGTLLMNRAVALLPIIDELRLAFDLHRDVVLQRGSRREETQGDDAPCPDRCVAACERGAVAVSRFLYASVCPGRQNADVVADAIVPALDRMGAEFRRRLDEAGVAPPPPPELLGAADSERAAELLREFLFGAPAAGAPNPPTDLWREDRPLVGLMDARLEIPRTGGLGFRGANEDYYSLEHSSLAAVLARRRGIPITLSIVYAAVARRGGLRPQMLNKPGHFLCALRHRCFNPQIGTLERLDERDPHGGGSPDGEGRRVGLSELTPGWRENVPASTVASYRPEGRHVVRRLFNNIAGILESSYEYESAIDVLRNTLVSVSTAFVVLASDPREASSIPKMRERLLAEELYGSIAEPELRGYHRDRGYDPLTFGVDGKFWE